MNPYRSKIGRRRWIALLAAVLLGLCVPAAARAAPSAKLGAAFVPERLGQRTTLGFAFPSPPPPARCPPR